MQSLAHRKKPEWTRRPTITVLLHQRTLTSPTHCTFIGLYRTVVDVYHPEIEGSFIGRYRLISVPLPTMRLASCAVRALEVDPELSSHVRRSLTARPRRSGIISESESVSSSSTGNDGDAVEAELSALFEASTNRLLRVAVNGYMESLRLVIGVMEELDVDVLAAEGGN